MTYRVEQQSQYTVQLYWSVYKNTPSNIQQRYVTAMYNSNGTVFKLPYMFIAPDQNGKLELVVYNHMSTPIKVEVGAALFRDGLEPAIIFGLEEPQRMTISYAGRSVGLNPWSMNVDPGQRNSRDSRLIIVTGRDLIKDGILIVRIVIKTGDGRILSENLVSFAVISVAPDDPLAIGGPYVPTNNLDITHVAVVEGIFAPFVQQPYQALRELANRLGMQDVLNQLAQRFDAQILGIILATTRNGYGNRNAKAIILLKEASPIAPILIIITVLAALAITLGIIYFAGQLIQNIANLNITKTIESAVDNCNNVMNRIMNDPNLTPEQKQQMMQACTDLVRVISEGGIDKAITINRSSEPPIGGNFINTLGAVLFLGAFSMIFNMFDDI